VIANGAIEERELARNDRPAIALDDGGAHRAVGPGSGRKLVSNEPLAFNRATR